MNITLAYNDLKATVKRSLSIIGKRSVDDKGNPMFKDITFGSLEEPILEDFFNDAAINLRTQVDQFIIQRSGTSITLSFPSNHNAANESTMTDAFSAYCVSYALYSWLVIVAPRIAQKYLDDANRQLDLVVRLAYTKKPPA